MSPKSGLMIRQNLADTAAEASLLETPNGNTAFQYRDQGAWSTSSTSGSNYTTPVYLKLTKTGDTITSSTSSDGATWTTVASQTLHFTGAYYVGMAVDSENNYSANTATFDNFAVTGTTPTALPNGWSDTDIGSPTMQGSASYDNGTITFSVNGGGTQISGTSDQFNYAYQELPADGSIIAHLADAATTSSTWALGGIMIRNGLSSSDPHAAMILAKNGTVQFLTRATTSATTSATYGTSNSAWLKLTRSGTTLTGYTSSDGATWTTTASTTLTTSGTVYIGLVANSGNTGDGQTVAFDHVTTTGITPTVPATPTNLTLTFPDSSYARLTWDPAAPTSTVTGYNLYMSTGGAFSLLTTITDPTASSYDLTGLSPNTPYAFHLTAKNASNTESTPASASANSGDGINAATDLITTADSITSANNASSTLSWTNHAGTILKTFVELKEKGDSNWFTLVDVGYPATTTTASLTGLAVGGTYQARVRTITDTGSAYSQAIDLDVPAWDTDPGIAGDPSTGGTQTDPLVLWTNSSGNPTDHVLLAHAAGTLFPDRWYGTSEFSTQNLTPAANNYTWLGGHWGGIVADGQNVGYADPYEVSTPNSNNGDNWVAGTRDSNGKVHLTWTTQTGYQYQIMQLGGVDQDHWTAGTFDYDTWYMDPTVNDWAYRGAIENGSGGHSTDRTGYFAVDSSHIENGHTVYSPPSQLVDLAVAYTPQYFTATTVSDTAVRLEWDNTSYNETGFDLERSSDGGTTWTALHPLPDQTQFMDTGLTPGANYTYKLRATRDNTSLDSQWVNATPSQLPNITAHIVMAGLPPAQNTEPGGYILINANDDNGSTKTNGIPATRDYSTSNYGYDPDLVAITLSATGATAGDTLHLSEAQNGTGILKLWTSAEKTQIFDLNQNLDATQVTTVYAEGTQMSTDPGDVVLTLDVLPATQPTIVQNANLNAAVTPIRPVLTPQLNGTPRPGVGLHQDANFPNDPTKTVHYLDSNIGGAVDSNGKLRNTIQFVASAAIGRGSGSLEVVQDVMIQNAFANLPSNTGGQETVGLVVGDPDDPGLHYVLRYNDPRTNPATGGTQAIWFVDEANPVNIPFADQNVKHANPWNLGIYFTTFDDTPSIPIEDFWKPANAFIKIRQMFTDTMVWKFADGTILPLAHMTWEVDYVGTINSLAGFTPAPAGSALLDQVRITSPSTPSNDVPPEMAAPTANGASSVWEQRGYPQ